MAKLHIPAQLRNDTNGQATIEIAGSNVNKVLQQLVKDYPNLKDKLFNEENILRRYVNIYLADEDIRFLDNLETELDENSELSIVPAIAGGNK